MSTKMRQYVDGSGGHQIETWWYKREGCERAVPVKSDNLKPVCLPVGVEQAIATTIKRLPK